VPHRSCLILAERTAAWGEPSLEPVGRTCAGAGEEREGEDAAEGNC